jgi:hypothetical protein
VRLAAEGNLPDQATIAAYLANRLDAAQAAAFEAYCLRHPEFARGVELDLYLRVGLKEVHRANARRRWRFGLGIAATVLLILAGAFLSIGERHTQPLIAYRSVTDVPASFQAGAQVSITLLRLRDSSAVRQIVAPRHANMVILRVLPDGPAGRLGYSVTLTRESSLRSQTLTIEGLGVNSDGYLELYLPLAALVGHTLAVAVTPAPDSGGASPLRVQIVPAADPPTNSP